MTTEIAIISKGGVALAADSMLSHRKGSLKGARKLFTLSDNHPVAVMIHNGACFMGDFWGENLVPAFKERQGAQRHPTIEAWTRSFEAFVRSYGVPSIEQKQANLKAYVDSLLSEIKYGADEEIAAGGALHGLSPKDAFDTILAHSLSTAPCYEKVLSRSEISEIRRWLAPVTEASIEEHIWIDGDAKLKRKVKKLIDVRIASAESSPGHSGIVIAGYGAQQHAPALCALEVDGYLGPVLKMHLTTSIDMAYETSARILPFAQRDMIDTFMTGMDDATREFVERTVYLEMTNALTELAGSQEEIDRYNKVCEAVSNAVMEKLERHCNDAYTDGVYSFVNLMPPHRLPEVARELVRMSVARHDYRIDQPSVGAPVDVAFISKARQTVDLRLGETKEQNWRLAS